MESSRDLLVKADESKEIQSIHIELIITFSNFDSEVNELCKKSTSARNEEYLKWLKHISNKIASDLRAEVILGSYQNLIELNSHLPHDSEYTQIRRSFKKLLDLISPHAASCFKNTRVLTSSAYVFSSFGCAQQIVLSQKRKSDSLEERFEQLNISSTKSRKRIIVKREGALSESSAKNLNSPSRPPKLHVSAQGKEEEIVSYVKRIKMG